MKTSHDPSPSDDHQGSVRICILVTVAVVAWQLLPYSRVLEKEMCVKQIVNSS